MRYNALNTSVMLPSAQAPIFLNRKSLINKPAECSPFWLLRKRFASCLFFSFLNFKLFVTTKMNRSQPSHLRSSGSKCPFPSFCGETISGTLLSYTQFTVAIHKVHCSHTQRWNLLWLSRSCSGLGASWTSEIIARINSLFGEWAWTEPMPEFFSHRRNVRPSATKFELSSPGVPWGYTFTWESCAWL